MSSHVNWYSLKLGSSVGTIRTWERLYARRWNCPTRTLINDTGIQCLEIVSKPSTLTPVAVFLMVVHSLFIVLTPPTSSRDSQCSYPFILSVCLLCRRERGLRANSIRHHQTSFWTLRAEKVWEILGVLHVIGRRNYLISLGVAPFSIISLGLSPASILSLNPLLVFCRFGDGRLSSTPSRPRAIESLRSGIGIDWCR